MMTYAIAGHGLPDVPLICEVKTENCSNFRRRVKEAAPYGDV